MDLLENEPAFVLHSRHYGETSLIVDLFTRSRGRLSVYARGARKRKKNVLAGSLAPFIPLVVSTQGRGALKSLSMFDAVAAPFKLMGRCLYCGFYLNELLVRLLPEFESEQELFSNYMQLIARLADAQESDLPTLEHYIRQFEWQLVQAAGVSFSLVSDAEQQMPVNASSRYRYCHGVGLVVADGRDSSAIRGRTLLCFAHSADYGDPERIEIKRFMRQVLRPLLGARPLASRALFAE